MLNIWRPYPIFKPKKDGWYLCTCSDGAGTYYPRVMLLHYTQWSDTWVNLERMRVFRGYMVYMSCRAPIDDNLVMEDNECKRYDVIAWKKVPRKCLWAKEYEK